jgi:hypothetical protein
MCQKERPEDEAKWQNYFKKEIINEPLYEAYTWNDPLQISL